MLALLPPPEFVQWGGVQATIEEEARLKAEGLVAAAAGTLVEESGLKPSITVRQGEARKVIREIIAQTPDIAAMVLANTKSGAQGQLVSYLERKSVVSGKSVAVRGDIGGRRTITKK